MRTIAQETASHIALRNCSEEVGEKVNIHVILVKGACAPKHTFCQKAVSRGEQMLLFVMLVLL